MIKNMPFPHWPPPPACKRTAVASMAAAVEETRKIGYYNNVL